MEEDEEDETVAQPKVTIGAQDIISLKTASHSGVLRYEGTFEKIVRASIILRPFFREAMKWRQRFVVLCEGCLYIYNDEYAMSPTKALSLAGYKGVKRIQGDEIDQRRRRMSFELEPITESEKSMKFCAISDEERKIWFQKIRKEIQCAARLKSDLKSDFNQDEYVHLEKPVQTSLPVALQKSKTIKNGTGRPGLKKPLPPVPGEKESEDSDTDSDYDKPEDIEEIEVFVPSPKPLPGLASPVFPVTNTRLTAPIKPKPPPKPQKPTKSFSRSEFDYNSNDRRKAEEILHGLPVGTFLVRKSRSDNQEVLSVKTPEGVKEYKIYNKEQGYSIDNRDNWFSSTEELLNFYANHDLPNRVLTLSRGYSSSDTNM